MGEVRPRLSARSLAVLELIAEGNTYEQILAAHPDLKYPDIFRAAEEALGMALNEPAPVRAAKTLGEHRQRHARAYEKWTEHEDETLGALVRSGGTVAQIAGRLQRNRGAIRSRIVKMGLVESLSPKEQNRLRRLSQYDGG